MTVSLEHQVFELKILAARQDKRIKEDTGRIETLIAQRDKYRDELLAAQKRTVDLRSKLIAASGLPEAQREQMEVQRLKEKLRGYVHQLDYAETMLKTVGGALRNNTPDKEINADIVPMAKAMRDQLAEARRALIAIAEGHPEPHILAQRTLK